MNSRRPRHLLHGVAAVVVCSGLARAQAGDVQGEAQPDPLPAEAIPPAPVLSPDEALERFRVPDGVLVELVAAEPLVHEPVHVAFDARGRLWVVEMRGYMPDLDGRGEREPVGSIAVLEDTDGDGRMDARSVFLERLVLPRAVALSRGGALVIAPPELLHARDTDEDGLADQVEVHDRGLDGLANPEYGINGLLPTLDGAWACANASWRYVFRDGRYQRERTAGGGQWGITRDDSGRIYFNGNSDPLRGDRWPSELAARNSAVAARGTNVRVVGDLHVKPARVNPGVNRAYRAETLDERQRLDVATGACGPWIHRGGGLPAAYRGAAFVCEPCGNLVASYTLAERDGSVSGEPLRNADGLDFLTSTDERFRPVNLCDGPDGALYVVDLYRGLIQHRTYVTSYLRKQVEARGLAQPLGLGRIWRVRARPSGALAAERPPSVVLADYESEDLVGVLAHENGWRRDTARRLLIEDGSTTAGVHAALVELALKSPKHVARIEALACLAAKGLVDAELARRAIAADDEELAVHGVRASRALASDANPAVLEAWKQRFPRAGRRLRAELLLTAGLARGAEAEGLLASWLLEVAADAELVRCAVSASAGREAAILARACATARARLGRGEECPLGFVKPLVESILRGGRQEDLVALLEALVVPQDREERLRGAVVEVVWASTQRDPKSARRPYLLAREPDCWSRLMQAFPSPPRGLEQSFAWPGKPGTQLQLPRALSADESARFARGRELYEANCVTCHQPSGLGDAALAPALRDSPWVLGDDARLVKILLHGLVGRIATPGIEFDGEMPSFALDDGELASLLTYLRREWGHDADPVTPERVKELRAAHRDRRAAWTPKEL